MYTITKSNGTTLVTIQDGTVNTSSTSIGLIGKNFSGYGQIQDTNFVKLLENFSSDTPPPNPLQGQTWYHRSAATLKVCPYDGAPSGAWVAVGNSNLTNLTLSGNLSVSGTTTLGTSNISSLTTTVLTTGGTGVSGAMTGRWTLNSGSSTANALAVTGKILANQYCYANGVNILDGISGGTDPVLTAHIANVSNPHSVTATQVGALPISGGTLTGTLTLNANAVSGLQPLTYQQGNAFVRATTLGTLPIAIASDLTGSESLVQAIVNVEAKVDALSPTSGNAAIVKFACSDLTTALSTGTNVGYERASTAFICSGVRASLLTASTSGSVEVDILRNGSSILSTKITIDVNEKTSVTAAIPPVLSSTAFSDDDEFTASILSAGTGATGLIVALLGATS